MTESRAALEGVQKALAACKEENAVLTDTLKEQASKISSDKVCLYVSHGIFVCHHLTDMKQTACLQKLHPGSIVRHSPVYCKFLCEAECDMCRQLPSAVQEAASAHENAKQKAEASTAEVRSQLEDLQAALQAAQEQSAKAAEELEELQESSQQAQASLHDHCCKCCSRCFS